MLAHKGDLREERNLEPSHDGLPQAIFEQGRTCCKFNLNRARRADLVKEGSLNSVCLMPVHLWHRPIDVSEDQKIAYIRKDGNVAVGNSLRGSFSVIETECNFSRSALLGDVFWAPDGEKLAVYTIDLETTETELVVLDGSTIMCSFDNTHNIVSLVNWENDDCLIVTRWLFSKGRRYMQSLSYRDMNVEWEIYASDTAGVSHDQEASFSYPCYFKDGTVHFIARGMDKASQDLKAQIGSVKDGHVHRCAQIPLERSNYLLGVKDESNRVLLSSDTSLDHLLIPLLAPFPKPCTFGAIIQQNKKGNEDILAYGIPVGWFDEKTPVCMFSSHLLHGTHPLSSIALLFIRLSDDHRWYCEAPFPVKGIMVRKGMLFLQTQQDGDDVSCYRVILEDE